MRGFNAFVNRVEGSADDYYADLSNPLQVSKSAVYVALTLIGDGFLVRLAATALYLTDSEPKLYRCYIVWGQKRRIIAFPALLVIATAGKDLRYDMISSVHPFRSHWVCSYI
jgi:hypothetical protein